MLTIENKKLIRMALFLSVFLCGLVGLKYFYFFKEKVHFITDSSAPSTYSYVADSSLYHFSPYEGKWLSKSDVFQPDFLAYFPDHIGDWVGHPVDHSYADITLFRQYEHKTTHDTLWLILVSGNHESQFHSAEVCYLSDGWDVAKRDIKKVTYDHDSFPIRYMIAQKNNHIHLVSSWYIWKSPRRTLQDGAYLFRLSLELSENEEQGKKLLLNFLEALSNLKIEKVERPKIPMLSKAQEKSISLPPVEVSMQSRISQARKNALNWILEHRVPNTTVPFPSIDRRYLILSYELDPDYPQSQNDRSYPFIYSRASIYDNALAVIALTMAKKYSEAQAIIDAFERIMRESGELWFSYNTHNEWPSESDHGEATIRNGASSWVGYSVTFFLRQRLLEDPNYKLSKDFERYLKLAQNVTQAILKDQVNNVSDPRDGLVTGGEGSFEYKWDEKLKKVSEKYRETHIEWASIEHNIDLYFLLKDLAVLSASHPEARMAEGSLSKLKQALLSAWNPKEKQFNRGMRKDGPDPLMALDCASWGLMYLLSVGDKEKAQLSKTILDLYQTADPKYSVSGYKPYYTGYVFDELSINQLFYPHKPTKDWRDVSMVWSEGSLGVAMAYLKLGEPKKAKQILEEMIKLQVPSGGFRYATHEIPFQFTPNPTLAGTAWFVMVSSALEDPGLSRLFWE